MVKVVGKKSGAAKERIEPLPRIDHDTITYEPFRRDFWTGVAAAADASAPLGATFAELNVTCHHADHAPPPPLASFAHAGLPPALLGAIARAGYEAPTPIQAAALPAALAGRDVVGVAKTGSGKARRRDDDERRISRRARARERANEWRARRIQRTVGHGGGGGWRASSPTNRARFTAERQQRATAIMCTRVCVRVCVCVCVCGALTLSMYVCVFSAAVTEQTLAFVWPLIVHAVDQREIVPGVDGPIALILAPTRELAEQTFREARSCERASERARMASPGGAPRGALDRSIDRSIE